MTVVERLSGRWGFGKKDGSPVPSEGKRYPVKHEIDCSVADAPKTEIHSLCIVAVDGRTILVRELGPNLGHECLEEGKEVPLVGDEINGPNSPVREIVRYIPD